MLTNNVERPRIPLNLRSEIGFVRTLSKNTRWNREKRADSVQSAVCEVRVLCFRDKRISPGKNHCHSTLAYRVRNARRGRAPRTTQNLPAPYSGKKICETAGSKDVSTDTNYWRAECIKSSIWQIPTHHFRGTDSYITGKEQDKAN